MGRRSEKRRRKGRRRDRKAGEREGDIREHRSGKKAVAFAYSSQSCHR